jgi:hypothetical protein
MLHPKMLEIKLVGFDSGDCKDYCLLGFDTV